MKNNLRLHIIFITKYIASTNNTIKYIQNQIILPKSFKKYYISSKVKTANFYS